jgi:hypothetical protein
MSVQVFEDSDRNVVSVRASGKLSREDYKKFVPRLEHLIRSSGKVNVLFLMEDFHGWKVGALWEDIKFDLKHFSDIRRLALVGDKRWERWMAAFCRPFTTARVRYFDRSRGEEARVWVQAT